MSNTPETDALREAIDSGGAVEAEMTSLAAKLERERDEAREDAKAADEHRRLAERLAEAAMLERDQLRMRVAELENGLVVEDAR